MSEDYTSPAELEPTPTKQQQQPNDDCDDLLEEHIEPYYSQDSTQTEEKELAVASALASADATQTEPELLEGAAPPSTGSGTGAGQPVAMPVMDILHGQLPAGEESTHSQDSWQLVTEEEASPEMRCGCGAPTTRGNLLSQLITAIGHRILMLKNALFGRFGRTSKAACPAKEEGAGNARAATLHPTEEVQATVLRDALSHGGGGGLAACDASSLVGRGDPLSSAIHEYYHDPDSRGVAMPAAAPTALGGKVVGDPLLSAVQEYHHDLDSGGVAMLAAAPTEPGS